MCLSTPWNTSCGQFPSFSIFLFNKQIDFSNSPEVVSSDFVGSRHASIFDSQATVVNGNQVIMYCWYDNEFGYSCQVMRVIRDMAGLSFPTLPL